MVHKSHIGLYTFDSFAFLDVIRLGAQPWGSLLFVQHNELRVIS